VVFAVTDAIYAPLSAKQVVRARQADLQASRNDSLLAVAEAYFNVQQARGEVAGAADSLRRTEEMVKKIDKVAEGLSPGVEKNRARAELAARLQAVETAYERWQTASADLNRLLRLAPSALVQPMEAPHLNVNLIDLGQSVDDLIAVGLTNRPELASQQALVKATLARLRQEKIRPWVPSVVIRGAATNPAGTLAAGYFGGGINDNMSNFGGRNSIDFQLLWEFQNLGLGNRALVKKAEAENQQAILLVFRAQDVVAAEVVQAHAQATRAEKRVRQAEDGVKNALITVEKNLEGLQNTRNIGGTQVLIFRPFEVIAAIQALEQAYRSYYAAIADSNRAQFRLYRAIGQPAQCLIQEQQMPVATPRIKSTPLPVR
jgi:outer membrane protein TolC